MAAGLVGSLLIGLQAPTPASAAPKPSLSVHQPKPVHATPVKPRPRPADLSQGAARRSARTVVWPSAGSGEAALVGPSADPRALRGDAAPTRPVTGRAGHLPVWVGPAATGSARRAATAGPGGGVSRARVQVLDRAAAPAGWRNGLLLRVARADGVAAEGRVNVGVDYSGFADAFGADWSLRLRLSALPECALTTPGAAGCQPRALPSRNDAAARRVSADVDLAAVDAAAGGTLLALSAGASGDAGDYGATPLQASSTWTAGGSGGDFSWSYPMRTPPSLGGPEPALELAYSSSVVDGRSDASNNQPSWIGEGFEYAPGFIERRYKPCAEDMAGSATNSVKTGDQCWGTDNAVLSLGGRSTELVKDAGSGRWVPKDDDSSKVERLAGASNGDNDGEYWKVTTADGVQYFFGRDDLPGQTSATDSTNYVRVYGNHPGEPCYNSSFAAAHCDQAWRWNLDYVVDTHGNTMSVWYARETNKYAANIADTDDVTYVRASTVARIDYGTWDRGSTDRSVTPIAQVLFTTGDRCLSSCSTHDEAHWPDTPWDQNCASGATSCPGLYTPTFWTTKRLSKVATRVAGVSGDVETWTFTHTWPDNGDRTRDGMWLESIVHAGPQGTAITLPQVNFDFVQKANRVDPAGDTKPPMFWLRMDTIWTETGGKIAIVYSQPQCVPGSTMPATPQSNTLRCYPVLSKDPISGNTVTDYFHKYVVTQIVETDWTGGGSNVITNYEYLGGAAWRHTDDDGLTKDAYRTWADYRGYATVRVRKGGLDGQTLTETKYYRGMHGDKASPSGGTRTVTLPAVDLNGDGDTSDTGDAPQVNDEDALAGQTRQKTLFNGVATDVVSTTVNQAWQSAPTATRDMGDTTTYARHTGVAATWQAVKLDGNRGWRVAKTTTAFDSYGMADTATDYGDAAVAGDEQCTDTSYARNTAANLLTPKSRVQTFAVACGQPAQTGDDVIGDLRTSYDNLAWGAAPTKGDVTKVETLKDWSQAGGTVWLTTARSSYDPFGRTIEAYDVRGNKTTTTYTPASGGPVTRVGLAVTFGTTTWTSFSDMSPVWAQPTHTSDINGKVTDLEYDALGRLTNVWLPNRPKASNPTSPSTSYAYLVRNSGGVNAVTTKTINAAGSYLTSYALYDGLLRARQTQTPALSGGGTVFTGTVYDEVGRVDYAYGNHHDPSLAAGTTLVGLTAGQPLNLTDTVYDGASRPVATILKAAGFEKWRTTTGYGGDRTYTTPPDGGTPTTVVTDVRGNTVGLRQHSGGITGPYDATSYTYNRKNHLAAVTDPAGNAWTYRYDLMGRQTYADDPDKGETMSAYNDYGDLTSTTDARDHTLVYEYDLLGRKVGLYDNAIATANRRATWAYDPSGAKGKLASSSRWTTNGTVEYKVRVRGYNALYQSGGEDYTIPAAETGLAGTYSLTRTYRADGVSLASVSYPLAGGLGGELVTYTYDATTGLPEQARTNWPDGSGQYVANTNWTAFGELATVVYQPSTWGFVQRDFTYDDTTRRLVQVSTDRQIAPQPVADVHYDYDDAGNITRIADTPGGGTADIQCFDYDYARRLTEAWTPSTGDCAAAPTVAGLGGPAPYWHSWTFDAVGSSVGNRGSETTHATTNTVATYTHPAAGADRPHATIRVVTTGAGAGTKNYTYDAAGNTTCRPNPAVATNTCPSGAGSQTLTWNSENRLESVVDGSNNPAYLYDGDGNRLITRDATGKTLHLPGNEIRYTSATGTTTATRYYSHLGQTFAMRQPGSNITWLVGDPQGTQTIAIAAGDQAITQRRQTPYGAPRGTSPTWPNPKGFLGGDSEPTGLTHLGAREYDPTTGQFISVDPIMDLADPQQWNGYAYAHNNPVTNSDPSGLIDHDCMEFDCYGYNPQALKENGGGCPHGCGTKANTDWGKANGKSSTKSNQRNDSRILGRVIKVPPTVPLEEFTRLWNEQRGKHFSASGGLTSEELVALDERALAMNICHEMDRPGGCQEWIEELYDGFIGFLGETLPPSESRVPLGVMPGFGGAPNSAPIQRGCRSFSTETRVLMADGKTKPINQIKVGDEVMATDIETGEQGPREVTHVWVHNDKLVDLLVDDAIVATTEDHPFWNATDRQWQRADAIGGDDLLGPNGRHIHVNGLRLGPSLRAPAYNLSIDNIHTYYVIAGNTPVLVHNDGDEQISGTIARGPQGMTIQIYANDHGPPHAHLKGQGFDIQIGQNGKPLDLDIQLNSSQQRFIDDNIRTIRGRIGAKMREYRLNRGSC